jgi:ATP-dependent helicase/nuclease subunit A
MTDPVRAAQQVQMLASDPARAVVLEAAAGAGKTKVLVDRFLRLCLAGAGPDVDPHAILAITFTRKATVEIQARLQEQALRLAGLAPAQRRDELAELCGRAPLAAESERAAWFHETLLEDPVGLGIETVHAFCQRVLGRFAADAGLDPRFAVIEEQEELQYRAEALDRLEAALAADPAAAATYADLAETAAGARGKVAELFDRRVYLQRWLDRVAPPANGSAVALGRPLAPHVDALAADLTAALLRDTPLAGAEQPEAALLAPGFQTALREFAGDGLAAVAATDAAAGLTAGLQKQLDHWRQACRDALAELEAAASQPPAEARAAVSVAARRVTDALLTDGGKLRVASGRQATKTVRQAAFATAAAPVLRVVQQLALLDLLAHNRSLLWHGLRALDFAAALKRRDRVVDFQDLEELALRLLTDPVAGPQVHFRLDARLDHLLLDEFQDTNRNQWDLLRPLLAEILAGGEIARTALVVGDVKQSIYGFRGAEPAVFGAARELIVRQAGPQAAMVLPTNFRSLPAITAAVGGLCQQEPLAGYLGAEAAGARQATARNAAAGEVVCVQPFQRDGERSGHERAAAAMVGLIRRLLDAGVVAWDWDAEQRADVPRPLRRDDILVLTRFRTRAAVYETALRRAGIPFTPAGRGLLARAREVQDVLALLRWLTYPADDTAGATVLRSPLCRLPEPMLQDLLAARLGPAPGMRRRSLREVLGEIGAAARAAAPSREPLAEIAGRIEGWFRLAGVRPLHDVLRRLYREGEVLLRFEIAHGEQARYNLLRLLDLALAAETRGGSLRDFVDELERAARLGGLDEGALPGEAGTGRVRVMTIHAAKGLQAPVVILADAAVPAREATPELLLGEPLSDGPWVFGVRQEHTEGIDLQDGGALAGPLSLYHRQARHRALTEEAHILYVALTRARDRLFVLGGCNDRQSADQTARSFLGWIAQAEAAIPGRVLMWRDPDDFLGDPLPDVPAPADPDAVSSEGDRPGDTATAAAAIADAIARRAKTAEARLLVWKPPQLPARFELVRPSQVAGAPGAADPEADGPDALDASDERAVTRGRRDNPATRRGSRIHAWLERACLAGRLPPPPDDPDLRAEWEEVRAVWDDPALAWVFAPAAAGRRGLCEVPVLHRIAGAGAGGGAGGERRLLGVIDRLVLRPGRADIVDYKTNRIESDQIEAHVAFYRPQLLAYRQALAAIDPDRAVRCWLLWTAPALAAHRLTEVR